MTQPEHTSPAELLEQAASGERCPACFTRTSAPTCPRCGFPLTDPHLGELRSLTRIQADGERRREALIARVRANHQATTQQPSGPTFPAGAAAPPTAPPTSQPPSAPPPAAPEPSRSRRLTVPVLLLIIGVGLVAIAALVFLTVAWFVAGIAVRALIMAGLTAIAMATASWLARRRLPTTAEGVAVLGALLLGLDAWGLRASGLLGTALPSAVYTGIALLVLAIAWRGWARLAHLRAPSLLAALAFPSGIGFLVGGAWALPLHGAVPLGLLGAAVGGLSVALPTPWSSAADRPAGDADRIALVCAGLVGLTGSTITAIGLGALPVALFSLGGSAAVAAGYAWLLRPGTSVVPRQETFRRIALVLTVLAVGSVGPTTMIHGVDPIIGLAITLVLTSFAALALDLMRARVQAPGWLVLLAAIPPAGSGFSAGLASLTSLVVAMVGAPWHAEPWEPAQGLTPTTPLLGAAALLVAGLPFLSPSLKSGPFRGWRPVYTALIVITGVGLMGGAGAVTVATVALAYASLIGLWSAGRRDPAPTDAANPVTKLSSPTGSPAPSVPRFAPGTLLSADTAPSIPTDPRAPGSGANPRPGRARRPDVVGWLTAGLLAAAIGFATSLASPALFFPAAVAVVALPLAQRAALPTHRDLALGLATTSVAIAVLTAFLAPGALGAALGGWWTTSQAWAVPGLGLAVVLLLLTLLPVMAARTRELTANAGLLVGIAAAVVAAFAVTSPRDAPGPGQASAGTGAWLLAIGACTVLLLVIAIGLGRGPTWAARTQRALASGIAPLAALSAALLAHAIGGQASATWATGIAVGSLVIAGSALVPAVGALRGGFEGAGSVVLIVFLIGLLGVGTTPTSTWVVVVCTTACALLVAAFGFRVPSAETNLALGVLSGVALLAGLAGVDRDVPGGMAPLVVAGLGMCATAWLTVRRTGGRSARDAKESGALRGAAMLAPVLAAVGLAVLLHAMTSDRALRGYTEGAVGLSLALGALAIAGAALSLRGLRPGPWRVLSEVGSLGAVAAVWTLAILRMGSRTLGQEIEAIDRASDGTDVWPGVGAVDLWLGFALLATMAIVALARRQLGGEVGRRLYGLVGGSAAVVFAALELATDAGTSGSRLLWVNALVAGVLFLGIVWRRLLGLAVGIGAGLAVGWVAFAIIAPWRGPVPAELLTGPVALAAIAAGVIELRRNPSQRSWPALGVGLVLATVPSLMYDGGDPGIVRPVILGLVCVGLILWGVSAKLQAPLVVGSIVLAIHAVASLWPWIALVYESVWWWLWLGLGGVLLIVVAARYEQGKRLARTAFEAVTALR